MPECTPCVISALLQKIFLLMMKANMMLYWTQLCMRNILKQRETYPCSSHWGPPARRHQNRGSLHPALGGESLPDPAENRLHDHRALV